MDGFVIIEAGTSTVKEGDTFVTTENILLRSSCAGEADTPDNSVIYQTAPGLNVG